MTSATLPSETRSFAALRFSIRCFDRNRRRLDATLHIALCDLAFRLEPVLQVATVRLSSLHKALVRAPRDFLPLVFALIHMNLLCPRDSHTEHRPIIRELPHCG